MEDEISYQKFWDPLKSKLKGIKTVYFSADGVYNLINLPTLFNTDKEKYLFEEINIRPLTSARDLFGEIRPSIPNNFSIILGNPDFGGAKGRREEHTFSASGVPRNGISSLPGTVKEVELIGRLFEENGWRCQKWTQEEASEAYKSCKKKIIEVAAYRDENKYIQEYLLNHANQ